MGRRGNYSHCNSHHFTCYRGLTSIFCSLPQLGETRQKMNWHKCLWAPYIRALGSAPGWALYSNSSVLNPVLSLTEVEQRIDDSRPGGEVQAKKSLISFSVAAITEAEQMK